MRIIAGTLKSRKLLAPTGMGTRPTTDRARETLFNVLNNLIDFSDIRVLDLFAGSGALALEAISRGAKQATLIEHNAKAIRAAKDNIRELGIEGQVNILPLDVFRFLKSSPSLEEKTFDLIFADAPYDEMRAINELPALIIDNGWLATDGICAIEHRSNAKPVLPKAAKIIRELKVGEAGFTILSGTFDSHGN
jgi:16S rRNA (guanine966-N2)-methyltransferase